MKTTLVGIGTILIGSALVMACASPGYRTVSSGAATTTVVQVRATAQPFYGDLAPYGNWVYVSGPGWVWAPYEVQADWRPYRLGHWVFTDYGWTWASDEEWGWVTYHYGRWHRDPVHGWVWVPGTEWGPAWVAWHEGGGWIGWAPLPWQVGWSADVGLDWGGVNVTIEPSWWCFASARYLVDPGLRTRIVPTTRNVTLIQMTRNVTNYTYVENRIVNHGVKIETIGRAVGRAIPHYRVMQAEMPGLPRGGKVRGGDFVVYRPAASNPAASASAAANPAPAKPVAAKPKPRSAWERAFEERLKRNPEMRRVPPAAPDQGSASTASSGSEAQASSESAKSNESAKAKAKGPRDAAARARNPRDAKHPKNPRQDTSQSEEPAPEESKKDGADSGQ